MRNEPSSFKIKVNNEEIPQMASSPVPSNAEYFVVISAMSLESVSKQDVRDNQCYTFYELTCDIDSKLKSRQTS